MHIFWKPFWLKPYCLKDLQLERVPRMAFLLRSTGGGSGALRAVGVRAFAAQETVMSPYKGGPVYLWLRSSIIWTRRVLGRHWIRWLERNWDFQKMCMQGMPEMHIDPTKNRWRYMVDTSYYGGMLDKAHEDFYRYICMYPALAMFFYYCVSRIKDNDKDNFMAKWRVPKEE